MRKIRSASSALFLTLIFAQAMAWAQEVGFYSGSFDPVTKGHEAIIRAASAEPGIDKLYVLVNLSGGKNFNASSYERIDLLKASLKDLGTKVEFHAVLQENKENTIRTLANGRPSVTFIGQDSYDKLGADALTRPNSRWVMFKRLGEPAITQNPPVNVSIRDVPGITAEISSTIVRNSIASGEISPFLNPEVLRYIQQKRLYIPPVEGELLELERALFQDAFMGYKENLTHAYSNLNFKNLAAPEFKETQSRLGWAESFIRHTLASQPQLSPLEAQQMYTRLSGMLISLPRGQPWPWIPFIEKSDAVPVRKNPVLSIVEKDLVALNQKDYQINIDSYVEDRFAGSIRDFVNKHRAKLFLHDTTEDAALQFHRKDGFDQFYRVHSAYSTGKKTGSIAYNSRTREYRYVFPGLTGPDRAEQLRSQLGAAGFKVPLIEITHKHKTPLFTLNETGRKLRLTENDLVLIGFKNRVLKQLAEKGLSGVPITQDGLEMDLVTTSKGQRILMVKNMYGNEMRTALDFLYQKGARQIVYLGTTGGLTDRMNVGDLLLPTKLIQQKGSMNIPNDTSLFGDLRDSGVRIHHNTSQSWTQALLHESNAFLKAVQDSGAHALDIETKYLAEFLNERREVRGAIALVVSDLPMGKHTYEAQEASMKFIDRAVESIAARAVSAFSSGATSAPGMCSQVYLKAM